MVAGSSLLEVLGVESDIGVEVGLWEGARSWGVVRLWGEGPEVGMARELVGASSWGVVKHWGGARSWGVVRHWRGARSWNKPASMLDGDQMALCNVHPQEHREDPAASANAPRDSGPIKLEHCIELFTQPETLSKDEAW